MILNFVKKISKSPWVPICLFFVVFFGGLSVFLERSYYGLDSYHEGVMLKPALDVASGQVLFRDTFTQYGALPTYLQALFVKVFGVHLISLRYATLFFYFLGFLLYLFWARLLKLWWAAPLALLLILQDAPFLSPQSDSMYPWSSVLALPVQALAICLLLRQHIWPRWGVFGVGVLTLLLFHTRQPVGLVFFGAITLAYLFQFLHFATQKLSSAERGEPLRRLGFFWGGALISALLVLLTMYCRGSLSGWWEQNILWVFAYAKGQSEGFKFTYFDAIFPQISSILWSLPIFIFLAVSPFLRGLGARCFVAGLGFLFLKKFFSLGFGLSWGLHVNSPVYLIVLLFVSFVTFYFKREADGQNWSVWIVGCAALSSWLQVVPLGDPQHIFWALLIVLPWTVFHIFFWCREKPLFVFIFVLGLLPAAYNDATRVFEWSAKDVEWTLITEGVLKDIHLTPQDYASYTSFVMALEATQHRVGVDVPIKNQTSNAFFGTVAKNLANASPRNFYWSGFPIDLRQARGKNFILEQHPIVITDWQPTYDESPPFAAELRALGYGVYTVAKNIKFRFTGATELWFWIPKEKFAKKESF